MSSFACLLSNLFCSNFDRGSTYLFTACLFHFLLPVEHTLHSFHSWRFFVFTFYPPGCFFTAAMEGSSTRSSPEVPKSKDIKKEDQTSLIGSNWPSLPVPADSDSPIQPGQKSPAPWKVQQRGPDNYERDRGASTPNIS